MCVQRDFQSQASLVTHTHHRAMNFVTIWFFSFSLFPIVYRYYCDAPIASYTCRQFSSISNNVLLVESGCYITMQNSKGRQLLLRTAAPSTIICCYGNMGTFINNIQMLLISDRITVSCSLMERKRETS